MLRAVQSIFGSSIVLYAEKLVIQSVKASFHENALKDRIEENARALWALDKLAASKKSHRNVRGRIRAFGAGHSKGASMANTPAPSRPVSRAGSPAQDMHGNRLNVAQDGRSGDTVVDVPLTPRGDRTSYSYPEGDGERPSNLRRRSRSDVLDKEGNVVKDGMCSRPQTPDLFKGQRSGRYFRKRANSKTIAEQVRRRLLCRSFNSRNRWLNSHWLHLLIQLAEALSQATLKDKSRHMTATHHSAKKLARRLFEGLGNTRDYLVPSDFTPYFPTKADAEVAFALFDKDGNGDISKKEMRSAVQRIYRERKALKASLEDMGSAVRKLDGVMLAVCLIIILL